MEFRQEQPLEIVYFNSDDVAVTRVVSNPQLAIYVLRCRRPVLGKQNQQAIYFLSLKFSGIPEHSPLNIRPFQDGNFHQVILTN